MGIRPRWLAYNHIPKPVLWLNKPPKRGLKPLPCQHHPATVLQAGLLALQVVVIDRFGQAAAVPKAPDRPASGTPLARSG